MSGAVGAGLLERPSQRAAGSVFGDIVVEGLEFSGLQGKALRQDRPEVPTLKQIRDIMPMNTWEKDTATSVKFALLDVITTAASVLFFSTYVLPIQTGNVLLEALKWGLYAVITGTVAMGAWVTAHECGHGAFSSNRWLQDAVGYFFHSLMLVPYYSWQRSHAIHHANTNHIVDGETHVPPVHNLAGQSSDKAKLQNLLGRRPGEAVFGAVQLVLHLVFGWPAYLLLGVTGGPSRGVTNHFIPYSFSRVLNAAKELFPAGQKHKVWQSDIGIVAVLSGLAWCAHKFGLATVLGMYGLPLIVINAWLVGYTWLQHTDVDVPHLPSKDFTFLKGAFLTIDRPYDNMFGIGPIVDFLHHHIGSTHVVHHIDSTIPHYRAQAATKALAQAFPDLYLYDPTPIFKALWRVATKAFAVEARPVVRKSSHDVSGIDEASSVDGNGDELYIFTNR
jgi:fatty acid desaturase